MDKTNFKSINLESLNQNDNEKGEKKMTFEEESQVHDGEEINVNFCLFR